MVLGEFFFSWMIFVFDLKMNDIKLWFNIQIVQKQLIMPLKISLTIIKKFNSLNLFNYEEFMMDFFKIILINKKYIIYVNNVI